jgi:hypothetical protein
MFFLQELLNSTTVEKSIPKIERSHVVCYSYQTYYISNREVGKLSTRCFAFHSLFYHKIHKLNAAHTVHSRVGRFFFIIKCTFWTLHTLCSRVGRFLTKFDFEWEYPWNVFIFMYCNVGTSHGKINFGGTVYNLLSNRSVTFFLCCIVIEK